MNSRARPVNPPARPVGAPPSGDPRTAWLHVSPSAEEFERSSPGADALSTECLMNLLHVRDLLWARCDRVIRRHGLPSPTGFVILVILDGAHTPLSPRDIAERMFVTAGTMTGLIATLTKHGYVTTERTPGPGRRVLVDITDPGRDALARAVRELDPAVAGWFGSVDATEKLALLRVLGNLGEHLRTGAPSASG